MREWLAADYAATIAALGARLDEWTWRCGAAALRHAGRGGRVVVIAFGKAARRMAASLLAALPAARVRGLCVPPERDPAPLSPLETIPGGHPLPDAGSFRAAARALELCRAATADDHVVFLVSGGGSALLELPLDPTITVDEWRAFYRGLTGCGAGIADLNRIRRRLSAVKGGRLAAAAAAAAGQTTVIAKDVPGPLTDVASGPSGAFAPEPDTLAADLTRLGVRDAVPQRLLAAIDRGAIEPLPQLPDRVRDSAAALVVADEFAARQRFAGQLEARGIAVDQDVDVDDWPWQAAVDRLLERLAAWRARHPRRHVAIVTSGELSVRLPQHPGRGGRNQQFALGCALRIAGQPVVVLSCGTDGVDGDSTAAGAIVDGSTIARAAALGRDVGRALAAFDADPLLAAIGDAVVTGPTGVNVRDLRVLLAAP